MHERRSGKGGCKKSVIGRFFIFWENITRNAANCNEASERVNCNSPLFLILCRTMHSTHNTHQVVLRKKEERRVLSGHPWVFSNELLEIRGEPQIGELVELLAEKGTSLGFGFYNPHSLISFRLLTTEWAEIDTGFFIKRFTQALELRRRLYPNEGAFRVVHGEADFLPGLVVDKYNEYLCVQTLSYGMDMRLPVICDALEQLFSPTAIIERNESPLRTLEQLPLRKGVLRGTSGTTEIKEHGLRYEVDPLAGQKTGFYLDQRENRAGIRRFASEARVLDCFCNEGGFALNAAQAGAALVIGIDIAEDAILRARKNAQLNQLSSIRFEQEDAFQALKSLDPKPGFDIVVLDPPSFTRSKKNVQAAKRGYKELHANAFRVLKPGGVLMTGSCSHHIKGEVFLEIIHEAASKLGRRLQQLDWRSAAPDHPILPTVPETHYLKFGVFRVC